MLLVTYGINVGVFYAISTLLNTTIVMHFDYEVRKNMILIDAFHSIVHTTQRSFEVFYPDPETLLHSLDICIFWIKCSIILFPYYNKVQYNFPA